MDGGQNKYSARELALAVETGATEGIKLWRAWDRVEVIEEDGYVMTLSDVAFPMFNCVFKCDLGREPAEADGKIERIKSMASARGVPMAWWMGPSASPEDLSERLIARGFTVAPGPAGMAMDLCLIEERGAPPPGVLIREVESPSDLRTWCDIMLPVFAFPSPTWRAWRELMAAQGHGPGSRVRHYLAELNGRPAATSSVILSGELAMLANVATLPKARKRGIAGAMTAKALHDARREGSRVGALFATNAGYPLYSRMGFEEFFKVRIHVWWE